MLAREPKNYRARLALADLRQRSGAKPEEVEALLVEAIKANPDEAAPRLALVQHHLALRHAKAALAVAQDAVAALPDNLSVLDALGRSQWAAGDTQQAIGTFQKIASLSESPEPYLRLADVYVDAKDYRGRRAEPAEGARNLTHADRSAARADRGRRGSQEGRRCTSGRQGRPEAAPQARPWATSWKATSTLSQRDWDPAIVALRSALDRDPSTATAKRLHALYMLAGRSADAERFAAGWEHDHPRDADFIFHLGSMAMARKEYATAEARYRQVLALQPNSATALNNVAWLMVQQGEKGALDYAERANRLLPDEASIMDTLATRAGR